MAPKRSARLNKVGIAPALSHVEIVADRSGSMETMKEIPTQKLKELIKDQANLSETTGGRIEVSLTTFDNVSETWIENDDVKNLVDISDNRWNIMMKPRSTTRLIDTVYERAKEQDEYIKEYIRKMPTQVKNLNPIIKRTLIVYTDGLDNSSKRSARELNVLITEMQDKGTTAIFLGANQDAIVNGGMMGFNADTTMTMGSDPQRAATAMSCVNNMCRAVSSDADGSCRPSFTPLERESSAPKNSVTRDTFDSNSLGPPPPYNPRLNGNACVDGMRNQPVNNTCLYTGGSIKDQWSVMTKKFAEQNDDNFNVGLLPPPGRLTRSVANPVPDYSYEIKTNHQDNGYLLPLSLPLSSPVSRGPTPISNHSTMQNNYTMTPEEIAANALVSMAMQKATWI